jgi:hypothetical protein
VSGLVMPPVQNSVQSLSIWLRKVPVIMRFLRLLLLFPSLKR